MTQLATALAQFHPATQVAAVIMIGLVVITFIWCALR